jgi:hypothetical protein
MGPEYPDSEVDDFNYDRFGSSGGDSDGSTQYYESSDEDSDYDSLMADFAEEFGAEDTHPPGTNRSVTTRSAVKRSVTNGASTSGVITSGASVSGAIINGASVSGAITSGASASGVITNQASASGAITNQASASGAITNQASASGAITNRASAAGATTNKASANQTDKPRYARHILLNAHIEVVIHFSPQITLTEHQYSLLRRHTTKLIAANAADHSDIIKEATDDIEKCWMEDAAFNREAVEIVSVLSVSRSRAILTFS